VKNRAPALSPLQAYQILFDAYGPQHWWPADSPFEVMIGAILTQNTSWKNVEKAIANLKALDMLDCEKIASSNSSQLGEVIRPSGFYMQKAHRLQQFCLFYISNGERKGLIKRSEKRLRHDLLKVHGIGPETADSILLYAFDKPAFVVDGYTRRIFIRMGLFSHKMDYAGIQHFFTRRLPGSLLLFQEFHALIVKHAKQYCRVKPLCPQCPLGKHCPAAAD
jgi:endonuclease-3 related protein